MSDNALQKPKFKNFASLSTYRSEIMGISAIFIMICHSQAFCKDIFNGRSELNVLFGNIAIQFNIGVDIFLILSGIGLYYAYEKHPKFINYYLKRVVNVYIPFVIINLIRVIYFDVIKEFAGHKALLFDASGLSFFMGKTLAGWYVLFAMLLYLVYPLIYKCIKILQKTRFELLILIAVIISLVSIMYIYKDNDIFNTYEIALTRIPVFLAGCYCGRLTLEKKQFGIGFYSLVIFGFVIKCICIYIDDVFFNRISSLFSAFTMIYFVLIFFQIAPKFLLKFFKWLGTFSLELYLTHYCIYKVVYNYSKELRTIWIYLLIIAVSLILSVALNKIKTKLIKKLF